MMAARASRPRGNTLPTLAALLVLSALIRAGGDLRPAFAQETASPAPQAQTVQGDIPTAELLAAFQAREVRLAEREGQVRDRLQALRVAEAEIAEKLESLRVAEERLSVTIARAETASASDVGLLTSVYENMKPKEAAALFTQMPPQFAAGFLALMRPESAALIMSELAPETAYAFSVVLAGRNANVPTD